MALPAPPNDDEPDFEDMLAADAPSGVVIDPSSNMNAAFQPVLDKVEELHGLETRIFKGLDLLEELRLRHRDLSENEIPKAMADQGVADFTFVDGRKVEIRDGVKAAIPKKEGAKAYEWLESNGHGDIIKNLVVVEFVKEDHAKARLLLDFMRAIDNPSDEALLEMARKVYGQFREARSDRSVHWATLTSWVKEMTKAGKAIPDEILGVYRRQITRIEYPGGGTGGKTPSVPDEVKVKSAFHEPKAPGRARKA